MGQLGCSSERITSAVEVLNDQHCELTKFFRCFRERPLELIDRIKFRLLSQEELRRWRAGEHKARSETERAATFFWLLKLAFGSRTAKPSFGYRLDASPRFRAELVHGIIERAHDRLKHVEIFNEDFEMILKRLDRPTTFFYCDPPYYGYESYYEERFSKESHGRLAKTLRSLRCDAIRQLYDWARIEQTSTKYSCGTRKDTRQRAATELLISNYEL